MTPNQNSTPAPPPTTQHSFRPGQVIFQEGQNSTSLFLIRKGTVSIRKQKGHNSMELSRVYANEVLGELSFFDRLPRSASAVALTEVEALQIPFESLEKIYSAVPDYVNTIVASMADRLRKANETIKKLQREFIKEEEIEAAEEGNISATEALALTTAAPVDPSSDSGGEGSN